MDTREETYAISWEDDDVECAGSHAIVNRTIAIMINALYRPRSTECPITGRPGRARLEVGYTASVRLGYTASLQLS